MSYVHGKSIIRIAIADADELLQDLLPGYIDSIENCKVVLQAFSGPELIEKLKQKPDTDLVIMDIRLPEMDGIEAAKKIKSHFPGIKILIFSIYQNELAFCRVIGAGCDGLIKKGSACTEFRKAIYEIMKTGQYFPGNLHKKLKQINGKTKSRNGFSVSDEEVIFLKFVSTGLTYDAIASKMKTNLRHIDYVRQGLFEKYEVQSRVELAMMAYEGGIAC